MSLSGPGLCGQSLTVSTAMFVEEVNKVRMEQNLLKKKKGGCGRSGEGREEERFGWGLVGSFESLVGKAGEEAGVRES